jgi:hypothetical protein
VDLTRDIIYRGFTLNDETISDAASGGGGDGTGIIGCVVDSADISDVDVTQFIEKRSQTDGMDAGDVFLGARRVRMSGTLYNVTRSTLYDDLADLRAALSPVLAQREEPLDHGYRPLYFSWPTNRTDDYPTGVIELQVKAMPRSFQAMFMRDQLGGDDDQALAIPWQATWVCRDPSIMGADPQDYLMTAQTLVTGATAATNDLVTSTAHGLVAGDRVRFTTLTAGTGLSTSITYYVLASGLTANAFKVSLTSGGAIIDITVAYTTVQYVKSVTKAGTVSNRGTYLSPVNGLFEVGRYSGQISGTIGDSTFTITIPASTGTRIIRFKGEDKVLTVEEDGVEVPRMDLIAFTNDTTWPLIDPGDSAYSITTHGGVLVSGSHVWFYERYA